MEGLCSQDLRSHDLSDNDTGEEEGSSDEWEDKREPCGGENEDFRNKDGYENE